MQEQIVTHSTFPMVKRDLFSLSHFTEHPAGIISRPGLGKPPHCSGTQRTPHFLLSLGGWEAKEAAAVLAARWEHGLEQIHPSPSGELLNSSSLQTHLPQELL